MHGLQSFKTNEINRPWWGVWRENPTGGMAKLTGDQGGVVFVLGLGALGADVEARRCTLVLETQAPLSCPQQLPCSPHSQVPVTSQVPANAGSLTAPWSQEAHLFSEGPWGAISNDSKLGGSKQQKVTQSSGGWSSEISGPLSLPPRHGLLLRMRSSPSAPHKDPSDHV